VTKPASDGDRRAGRGARRIDWRVLALDDVSLTFNAGKANEYRALRNATLRIERGEFYCLLGPSGCGKSTILNLVAGFLRPDSGAIHLDDREILGPGTDRVVVFQDASNALMPWLRASENVEFGLSLQGLSKATSTKRAIQYLDLVGLADHARKFPYELSGGMKQRCQLARALVLEPQVLLMDEPFAALDAITKRIMQKELVRIWRQYRTTVVYITHDVEEALLLGQRIGIMKRGPGSSLKREIVLAEPYPRNITDRAIAAAYVEAEASLEEEVGATLHAH
jgi:NitT/TauT family transport system ATP-binding protein